MLETESHDSHPRKGKQILTFHHNNKTAQDDWR